MDENLDSTEHPYPPAPWRMRGYMWMGLFPTERPASCPAGLAPLRPHRLVVGLVRYREGTLRYGEFYAGTMVRLGARVAVFVHGIWVDDLASLWGGRRIWGLDKQLAEFRWTGDHSVTVTDERGTVAALNVVRRSPRLPPVWAPMTGLGSLGHHWAVVTGRMWTRMGGCRMQVTQWSDRLPGLRDPQPRVWAVHSSFRMTVPAPALVRKRAPGAVRHPPSDPGQPAGGDGS